MKQKIREAIIVEGRYDINTIKQVVDTIVLETGGFRIFKNEEQLNLIRQIAETRGLIILTDSDGAGFVIRGYLKGALAAGTIKQAYIPDIAGKERRKRHSGKEGKLGVEGMKPETILTALRRAGATFEDNTAEPTKDQITKADLYEMNLAGQPYSKEFRLQLIKTLQLPEHISTNALLDVINASSTKDEIKQILKNITK